MADLQLLTYSLYSSMSAADCIEVMTATRQPTRNGSFWQQVAFHTGKVNLVYHQSILCSGVSYFESSSDRSNRESIFPWNMTFWETSPFKPFHCLYSTRSLSYFIVSEVYISFQTKVCPCQGWWRYPQSHFKQSNASIARNF